jgi:CheY-like chemotaxis protein
MNTCAPVAPLRVLVVDDSADMCASMAMLLELWGHDARVASDGPAALENAAEYGPDVILLDLGMPGMDGYEVAMRLRQQLGAAQPLLVSMSGHGGAEQRRRALDAGCDLHWVKPAEPDELRRLLESRQRARDARELVTDCTRKNTSVLVTGWRQNTS